MRQIRIVNLRMNILSFEKKIFKYIAKVTMYSFAEKHCT